MYFTFKHVHTALSKPVRISINPEYAKCQLKLHEMFNFHFGHCISYRGVTTMSAAGENRLTLGPVGPGGRFLTLSFWSDPPNQSTSEEVQKSGGLERLNFIFYDSHAASKTQNLKRLRRILYHLYVLGRFHACKT